MTTINRWKDIEVQMKVLGTDPTPHGTDIIRQLARLAILNQIIANYARALLADLDREWAADAATMDAGEEQKV